MMRSSRVLANARRGAASHGVAIRFTDESIHEYVAMLDYDAIWLDLEHHHISVERAAGFIRAARAGGATDVIARPGKGEFARMARLLEAGARGIMYPRCDSAAEAADVVRWAKFPPLGERGIDGAGADNPYRFTPVAEYLPQAIRETFIIIQIEDPAALDQCEAIAAVEGVDFLMLGPGDFSASIGRPGRIMDPEVLSALGRVRDAAAAAGKFWAATCPTRELAQECFHQGAALIFHGSDLRILQNGLADLRQDVSTWSRPTAVAAQ